METVPSYLKADLIQKLEAPGQRQHALLQRLVLQLDAPLGEVLNIEKHVAAVRGQRLAACQVLGLHSCHAALTGV